MATDQTDETILPFLEGRRRAQGMQALLSDMCMGRISPEEAAKADEPGSDVARRYGMEKGR